MIDGIKGLIAGFLAGIVFFYSLRPKQPYPIWITKLFDQPWTLLVLLVAAGYLFTWEPIVGALLLIITLALFTDMVLLTRKAGSKQNVVIVPGIKESRSNSLPDPYDYTMIPDHPFASAAKAEPYPEQPTKRNTASPMDGPGLNLNAIPLDKMEYPMFYGLEELPPGSPGPF